MSKNPSSWTWLRLCAINKQVSRFTINIYNDGSGNAGAFAVDYVVVCF